MLLPRRAAAFREGPEPQGGTGKAEDAKLPGAGISPKQCPGKGAAEKGYVADSVTIARAPEQGRELKLGKSREENAIREPTRCLDGSRAEYQDSRLEIATEARASNVSDRGCEQEPIEARTSFRRFRHIVGEFCRRANKRIIGIL